MMRMVGAVRVQTPEGTDVTPPGSVPRALLAVLALSPGQRAARRWIEALLWPDSTRERASASLRDTLRRLRRALAPHDAALGADNTDLWLNRDRIGIDLLDTPQEALAQIRAGRMLLEGLDLTSEDFEDWLRLERSRCEARAAAAPILPEEDPRPTPPPSRPLLLAQVRGMAPGLADFMAEAIATQLGQSVTDHIVFDTVLAEDASTHLIRTPGARCTITVSDLGAQLVIMARMSQEPSGKHVWSRTLRVPARDDEAGLDMAAALAFEISEAAAYCQGEASEIALANALAASALGDVFSFDPERMARADAKLERANGLAPHAPRPALRALAQAFLSVERTGVSRADLREAVMPLLESAQRLDPRNPLALAFVADVHDLVFEDPLAALFHAERALQVNAGTGYAHASLGALELRRGRAQDALSAARRARRQLDNTSLEVFALLRFCAAAISTGAFGEAEEAAARAALLAPASRPPLRHLYALRLHRGDTEGARAALTALHRLEPDFSMARLREDLAFPAATIRKAGFHLLGDVET